VIVGRWISVALGRPAEHPPEIALPVPESQYGDAAEQRREGDAGVETASLMVDVVLKPGVVGRVARRHIFDHDQGAIRQNDAIPDHERSALAGGDSAIKFIVLRRAVQNHEILPNNRGDDIPCPK
jgi:hypothetical protein